MVVCYKPRIFVQFTLFKSYLDDSLMVLMTNTRNGLGIRNFESNLFKCSMGEEEDD